MVLPHPTRPNPSEQWFLTERAPNTSGNLLVWPNGALLIGDDSTQTCWIVRVGIPAKGITAQGTCLGFAQRTAAQAKDGEYRPWVARH